MIRLTDVTLAVSSTILLEHAELHVRPADRIGLVGRNGTGKTSLLRLLTGELDPAAGTVQRKGGMQLGYLQQHGVSGSTRTVWEEAKEGMVRLNALADELRRAEEATAAGDPRAIERLDDVQNRFRMAGGYAMDEAVGEVLHGLGFAADEVHRPCDTFSGGWQMRIALSRLLLSQPDLLLLDEPTNHLDLQARSWLAGHLAGMSAAIVVVSHDRHLLDVATTSTVEIRGGRLHRFAGPYGRWLVERAQRDEHAQTTRTRQLAEVAKLERFVERFGAKATKAAQARSKQKAIDRIEVVDAPLKDGGPRLVLPEAPGCSEEVAELRGLAVGWGAEPVISDVDLLLLRGQRWAILGPNGTGKSTLLAALSGRLLPMSGRRRLGRDVRTLSYAQDLAGELSTEITPLAHVMGQAPAVTPQRARSALGALGLSGDDALRPIGSLSGGERARVVLATMAVEPANLLLLDEPTNHLDVTTVGVVADALDAFEGTIVLVTHDRWLVERLATHVAVVVDGTVRTYDRVLPEHLEPIRAAAPEKAEKADRNQSYEDRKARRRQEKRLEKLHTKADKIALAMDALDEKLVAVATDHEKVRELDAQRRETEDELEALFEEMAALEEELQG